MRFLWLSVFFCLACIFFAGCPAPTNPQRVWLGPGDSEALLTLTDKEPNPF